MRALKSHRPGRESWLCPCCCVTLDELVHLMGQAAELIVLPLECGFGGLSKLRHRRARHTAWSTALDKCPLFMLLLPGKSACKSTCLFVQQTVCPALCQVPGHKQRGPDLGLEELTGREGLGQEATSVLQGDF